MQSVHALEFDQAEINRFVRQFEEIGPAAPLGVDEFCESFESWIAAGATGEEDVARFRADLMFVRGMTHAARGEYESALADLHQSVAASSAAGNTKRRIFGLCSLAMCFEYAGMQSESSNSILEALELAENLGDKRIQAAVLLNLGSLYESQGAYEQMLEYTKRTFEIAKVLEDRAFQLRSGAAVALACAHLNWTEEGLDWIEHALAFVDDETPSVVNTYLHMNLMFLYRRADRLDEAAQLAEEYLDRIGDLPAQHAAVLYVDLAELQLAIGDVPRSSEMLALADSVSDPEWMKAHLLEYYRVAAELEEAKGEPTKALEMLRQHMQLESEIRGRQARTRLVALERHFAADLAAKTAELHHLRAVELVNKNDQLSELIEQNREILLVLVNDLKNPLAGTRLLTEALLREADDPASQKTAMLRSIESSTVEMGKAITRLLDLHYPQADNPQDS